MLERRYRFSWDLVGDIRVGRPNLGPLMRLEVYRLMQYIIRDLMEERFGKEETDEFFYKAGKRAGEEFYKKFLSNAKEFGEFIRELQRILIDMGVGILRVEVSDLERGELIITVSEDLDCSGLPELNYEVCVYDEGFIAGLLESFTGKKFKVKEVDCWCTGDRTCRFIAKAQ